MTSWFDLPDVDRFTAGTVGPPGERVFFLQAAAGGQVVTLRLEKAQVAALAGYLAELLADMPTPAPEEIPDAVELVEPVIAEWVVGQLGVAFDESRDRLVIRADELVDDPEEPEQSEAEGAEGGSARFALTRAQVAAFVVHAAALVVAGRPPCPLCRRPLDPQGHVCVKTNGHKPR
ncbi:MAG TPA: DUF3090 family protein [Acidimicrobiales bacterium]|nr:DUF3090 family protein [Acidimicrobiales bacterium]